MKLVSAAEANRNFSKLLGNVRAGEEFIITSHGRPVAQLVPVQEANGQAEKDRIMLAFFDELRSRPAGNLPIVTRDEIYRDLEA
jgi:prevent-host-death family protein